MKTNKANVAAFVGISFLELMGLAALSYTMDGKSTKAGMATLWTGLYASKKLAKKVKNKKHQISNEEIYILKMKSLLKLVKVQQRELKMNLNKYRIMLERVI